MTRRNRLQQWIKTLDKKQMSSILLDLTDYAIDSEYVSFYEDSKVPYYGSTGDTLDGTEMEED